MKCSCGHLNPVGIQLCEYCGKPQDGIPREKVMKEMRYEGKLRLSQISSRNVMDRVWKFFSSVKVAIYIILIILIMAGIGTIFPQEKFIPSSSPQTYYYNQYGIWGHFFYKIGFSDMYNSWWFILLLGMLGISLVICSLDRVVPLYRALTRQQVTKHIAFLESQRVAFRNEDSPNVFSALIKNMKKQSYVVRVEEDALFAEKGRLSRWGPYVNHLGLIIFLIGLLCSYLPGWYLDESLWVREGEVKKVPQTPYFVKSEKAFVEFHPNSSTVKKYQTNAVLYKKDQTGKLSPLEKKNIQVNHPLTFEDLSLYQSDMKLGEVYAITLEILKNGKQLGQFTVNLEDIHPKQIFSLAEGATVRIIEYYPEFQFDEKKQRPITLSNEPNRPAFIFEVQERDGVPERSWVISGERFSMLNPKNVYVIKLVNLHVANRSGLMVRIDKRLPILFFGGFITMVGLIMGFYWQHRRIWIRRKNGLIYLGAHTNKNWFGLQTEVKKIIPPDWKTKWEGNRDFS